MSIRYTITDQADVELSEDGKELEIYFDRDNMGNKYVDIPVEFVKKLLDADPWVSVEWFKTDKPLSDGWYWWRCGHKDFEPTVLEICNSFITDNRPTDSDANEIYEHQDFGGEWYGPIQPPKGNSDE